MTTSQSPEQIAWSNGWADFEDIEDPTLLVVAHDDHPVHFTGDTAWADAVAWDEKRAAGTPPEDRLVVVLKTLSTSGHCAWVTDDVFDIESGISGAGYDSLYEAVENAGTKAELLEWDIADLSHLGDAILQYSDKELGELVNQSRIPYQEWKTAK